jgi:hypothetical protein
LAVITAAQQESPFPLSQSLRRVAQNPILMMATPEESQVRHFVEMSIASLGRLESNLLRLGYRFANGDGAIRCLTAGTNLALQRLKEQYTDLPQVFVAWYDRVEYVDFRQERTQLLERSDEIVAGLGLNCTLVFESLSRVQQLQDDLESLGHGCRNEALQETPQTFIPTGVCASNSTPKGVWLPDRSNDPVLYDAGAGPVTMASEITRSLRAGGFPFWKEMFSRRRFRSPIPNTPRYPEILPQLMEGVAVPVLCSGYVSESL